MKVLKNYVYNLSYQLLVIILPIITTPYVTRVFSSTDLGTYGYFNSIVTYFILLATLAWTSLTILSYFMAFLFRTAIVSLLFLIPQIYNVGEFLSSHFEWGKVLPVALGNHLIASSDTRFSTHPFWTLALLCIWVFIFGVISYVQFEKSDVGGKY